MPAIRRAPREAGDYTPENCRWATRETQNQNRVFTVWLMLDGARMCESEVARQIGARPCTVNEARKAASEKGKTEFQCKGRTISIIS
jgi:hypothetical protein